VYLENDFGTGTHFKIPYDSLSHVYQLDGTCRPSHQLHECQETKVDVEVSGETIFHMRDATRGFEDDGYLVQVTTENKSQNKRRETIRGYATKSDDHKRYVLAHIDLEHVRKLYQKSYRLTYSLYYIVQYIFHVILCVINFVKMSTYFYPLKLSTITYHLPTFYAIFIDTKYSIICLNIPTVFNVLQMQ